MRWAHCRELLPTNAIAQLKLPVCSLSNETKLELGATMLFWSVRANLDGQRGW